MITTYIMITTHIMITTYIMITTHIMITFLTANKKYTNDEEKNEFFNIFINRVIVNKDSIVILYNNSPTTPKEILLKQRASTSKITSADPN